ncbi:hypothetical protein [Actinacidiphila soli]|uniref:hypothetical protein n=1 Tax=Actinacidiphila soli TaxID=2487275 RepID=UPI0013E33C99|nr:hypothetical protein [Actinacidiphila soli]
MIADVVTDVLHHMDGAEPAHMLIGAAYQVYQPVRRLLANRAYELAAQHHVLVPQNEQFGVLRESVAHQHSGEGQKPPGHLVQQRHDHPDMVPAEDALLLLPAATTIRAR